VKKHFTLKIDHCQYFPTQAGIMMQEVVEQGYEVGPAGRFSSNCRQDRRVLAHKPLFLPLHLSCERF
jgi:hypothetical protein